MDIHYWQFSTEECHQWSQLPCVNPSSLGRRQNKGRNRCAILKIKWRDYCLKRGLNLAQVHYWTAGDWLVQPTLPAQAIVDTRTFLLTIPEQYMGDFLEAVGAQQNNQDVGATSGLHRC
ncbi:hypothetical protein KIL84_006802 [Mauremys mutica]|uniref:Uncharacterized protein n=1 Tax=Mauremys mutica TaxID=74926 RepID=A0A9D3WZW3_9SAUR|nr:hypothetical protein KIL84_006802 [Mauremys mutica]